MAVRTAVNVNVRDRLLQKSAPPSSKSGELIGDCMLANQ